MIDLTCKIAFIIFWFMGAFSVFTVLEIEVKSGKVSKEYIEKFSKDYHWYMFNSLLMWPIWSTIYFIDKISDYYVKKRLK